MVEPRQPQPSPWGFVHVLFLFLFAQLASSAPETPVSQAPPTLGATPPKIILFVLGDDIGHNAVGFAKGSTASTSGLNGTSLTPYLDALASEGLTLDTMITAFWCTPSRSSFLTGRLPVHVQMGQDFPETPTCGIPRRMGSLAAKLGRFSSIVGKWDIGLATESHTPEGRGFNQSLIYWEHMADQWSQGIFPGGTACTLYDPTITDLWSNGAPAKGLNGTGFTEYLHRDRLMSTLSEWLALAPSEQPPLFLLYTPHVAHYPLQVPEDWLHRYTSFMGNDESWCNATVPYIYPNSGNATMHCRAQGAALMGMLDEIVGNLTGAIKAAGLWEDTLMVFQGDNGAPLDVSEAGMGNYPLRGGKYSSWQGGVQVPAFVSGGYLPPSRRGQRESGLVHIADWWETFLNLAGKDTSDAPAVEAGLPPPDSLDLWPLLSGSNATSPRVEVPIAPSSIISYPWKFLKGPQWWSGYSGEVYPNASSPGLSPDIWEFCGSGCLYNLTADPEERNNVADLHPGIVTELSSRIDTLAKGFYSNNDTDGVDICPKGTPLCGCWAAVHKWGGYFGPYQT